MLPAFLEYIIFKAGIVPPDGGKGEGSVRLWEKAFQNIEAEARGIGSTLKSYKKRDAYRTNLKKQATYIFSLL